MWAFNDMRADLQLWLAAEGFDLVQKKAETEATDAVDRVESLTDPRTGDSR